MENILSPDTALALMQTSQSNTMDAAKKLDAAKNADRIKEAAREFEAVFLSEMLKPMFEGIEPNETFGGGKGEEIFQGMMLQEYGKQIAGKNITGIQTQVMNTLIELQARRTQEEGSASSSAMQSGNIMDLDIIEE